MPPLPEQRDLVDGVRAPAPLQLGGTLDDPNTGVALQGRFRSGPDAVERALACADDAFRHGRLPRSSPLERVELLERIADALATRATSAATVESLSTGIPVAITGAMCAAAAGQFRSTADLLRAAGDGVRLDRDGRRIELDRAPWGPAALLVPWNAPLAIASSKTANALAAGCPVILKPSEWAPGTCNLLADAIEEATPEPGSFQLVHGDAAVGGLLVSDPRIRAVSFTGGQEGGRAVALAGVVDMKALQLELGSVNPAIVRHDADLELTANRLAQGMTKLNGQWCEAPRKVLVHRSRHAELVDALRAVLGSYRIGSSLEHGSDLGPISHRAHLQRLDGSLQELRRSGATLVSEGELPALDGWFMAPTLVLGLDSRRVTEELFGPALTIHPVASDAEAVLLANHGRDGLSGYVFSSDEEAAFTVGRKLQYGEVRINGTNLIDLCPESEQSFWDRSGIGGHGSTRVFEFFRGTRIVGVDDPAFPI